MKKLKLKMQWTCSDYVGHSHRWKLTAVICGQIQRFENWLVHLYLDAVCMVEGHSKVFWSEDCCREARVLSGRWKPWFCIRCGCESKPVHIPVRPK